MDRLIDEPVSAPAATARPRRRSVRAAPAVGSLGVHALLLAGFGAVVWRTAAPAPKGPDVSIRFEAPAMGLEAQPSGGPASPAPEATRPGARETEVIIAPEAAPAPGPPPSLPSLATSVEALSGEAAGEAVARSSAPLTLGADAFAPPESSGASSALASENPGAGAGGVKFAGLGASNARSVVYVVDASGSMVTSLPFVMAELVRSASGLVPSQKFGVVLFRRTPDGAGGVEVFAPVLVRATPTALARLREWVSGVQPAGRSVPLEGLERALAYHPDAVFLLSRSIERSGGNVWAEGRSATLSRIDSLNPDLGGRRAVVIQTIQFLDEDPTGIMQEIGRIHGSRTGPSGDPVAGYRVIRRGEELGGSK